MWLLGLVEVADWILVLLVVLVVTYTYFSWQPNEWKSRGVPGPPSYPFVGTNLDMFLKGQREMDRERYLKYNRVWGVVEGKRLLLAVGDADMLRQIMVKEFPTFVDRRRLRMGDDISKNMLTALRGDEWKRVRNLLTPSFSTGKLKLMMSSVSECCELLLGNLQDACQKQESFDCKRLFGGYTMDVIARTGFGIQVDSQKNPDNEFVRMSRKAFTFNLYRPLFLALMVAPWALPIFCFLGASLFEKDVTDFFKAVLEQTIEGRKKGSQEGKDFLQLMLNAHTDVFDVQAVEAEAKEMGGEYVHGGPTSKKGLSKNEIVAQGFLFFVAGYDTTATTLAMLFFSLAHFPEIQEKLHQEIVKAYGTEGELEYDSLNESPLLNMCIDETLRMYPPAGRVDRQTVKDIAINGIHIPKDTIIILPIIGIHYDPETYPEPEQFRPERFSAEKKAARNPFHYLPFGYGPRNCIGMRLAQMAMKMAAIQVIRNYKLIPSEKSIYPPQFKKTGGLLNLTDSISLRAERRQ